MCQAISTSEISQKIRRNLGFKIAIKIPMSEIVWNGKTEVERICGDSPVCEVVALSLYWLNTF